MATTPRQQQTHRDDVVVPELAGLHLPEKADGPGAAAMVAAGVGIFVLGLLTTLAEASEATKAFLERFQLGVGVGPLAGKTTLAVIVWAVVWIVLHIALRRRDVNLQSAFGVGVLLGVLGAIGTFPIFFKLFAVE
jgi:fluoride ion exporter CrcB/FEX